MKILKHRQNTQGKARWTMAFLAFSFCAVPAAGTLLYPFFQSGSADPAEDAIIYKLKTPTGDIVAALDKNGNLALAGTLTEGVSTVTSSADIKRVITGTDSAVKAIFEIEDSGELVGNLLLKGHVIHHEEMDSLGSITSPSPLGPSFKLLNAGHYKLVVDKDGNLHLRGRVFENVHDFDYTGPPDLTLEYQKDAYAGIKTMLWGNATHGWNMTAASFTWTKISGPGTVVFADAHAVTTGVTFVSAGTYVLRLVVDDHFVTAPVAESITVTVAAAPSPAPFVLCQ